MKYTKRVKFAKIVSEELGGYLISSTCFGKSITPLNKDEDCYIECYKQINEQNLKDRQYLIKRISKLIIRLEQENII